MKKVLYFLPLFALVIFLGWFFFQKPLSREIISPVLGVSKLNYSENLWFPKEASSLAGPEVTATAAFFVDLKTGEVLYQKNHKEKLSIASLNKIMTAIISLEYKSLEDELEVSKKASEMEPDKMLLIVGERLTVKELLEGVFLVSANDASEVLAEGVTTSRQEFIKLMNQKAKSLGMRDTLFLNPSGLEEDNIEQYSTAYDVILMSRYAITTDPKLLEISSQPHIYVPRTDTHQDYDLYSGINLLTTYPGVLGFKTGYTPQAGLTLVTVARREGREIIGVLLGATNRRDDAKLLLDYSFQKLGVKVQ